MLYFLLFITFFQIGMFGFGGGYGMLSLIQGEVVHHYGWMTTGEFTDIVAISQMTPGPIGINSATYCGYTAAHNAGYGYWMSVLGSAVATFALVLPSLILPAVNPWQFWISVFLFIATLVGTWHFKINPIRMIGYSGLAGLVLLY